MPLVVVEYAYGYHLEPDAVTRTLNDILPEAMPLQGRNLDPKTEFDIRYVQGRPEDQFTHRVTVRVYAHATDERAKDSDKIARKIRKALEIHEQDLGVSIMLAEVGWSSIDYDASASARFLRAMNVYG